MIKKIRLIPILLLLANDLSAQDQRGIGYTGGWLNSNVSIAGGLAFYFGQNIIESPNASLSISTNLKIGMEDKVGTGLIIPALVVLGATSNGNAPNINTDNLNGGKIHLFTDIPLLLHYNWGLGSNEDTDKRFGFYLGGGMSYTTTGFTDTAGFSKGTAFYGYVIDGGIRFKENIDLNFARVIPLRQPIGPIIHPIFYEITLSTRF